MKNTLKVLFVTALLGFVGASHAGPVNGLTCKKQALIAPDGHFDMGAYKPGFNMVFVKDKHMVVKAGGALQDDLSFQLQNVGRDTDRSIMMGSDGQWQGLITLDHGVIYVALHQYNTPLNGPGNGRYEDYPVIQHIYFTQCE